MGAPYRPMPNICRLPNSMRRYDLGDSMIVGLIFWREKDSVLMTHVTGDSSASLRQFAQGEAIADWQERWNNPE